MIKDLPIPKELKFFSVGASLGWVMSLLLCLMVTRNTIIIFLIIFTILFVVGINGIKEDLINVIEK